VIHALTHWATERGAQRIYLLVERDNAPAHALYARTGFSRSHGYHYRAAPELAGRGAWPGRSRGLS
jgi:N-acetylglutamate synthase